MKLQDNYDVGIYCRLSRDDHNGTLESMSIANQRQVLVDYVTEKGWTLRDCYIDDCVIIGISGINRINSRVFGFAVLNFFHQRGKILFKSQKSICKRA